MCVLLLLFVSISLQRLRKKIFLSTFPMVMSVKVLTHKSTQLCINPSQWNVSRSTAFHWFFATFEYLRSICTFSLYLSYLSFCLFLPFMSFWSSELSFLVVECMRTDSGTAECLASFLLPLDNICSYYGLECFKICSKINLRNASLKMSLICSKLCIVF